MALQDIGGPALLVAANMGTLQVLIIHHMYFQTVIFHCLSAAEVQWTLLTLPPLIKVENVDMSVYRGSCFELFVAALTRKSTTNNL